MPKFTEQKFNIPKLKGISSKNIEEHLKLYAGYVKFSNLIGEKITEYKIDSEKNSYILGELQRRFSFEFNGMRNHEYYFASLENGPKALSNGVFMASISNQFGNFDTWLATFKSIALTRGIGWAILYYDQKTKQLVQTWIDEQHLGQLNGCKPILAIDMWEHAYVADYHPSGKKQYVEDFFDNINWSAVENNYKVATI